MSKILIKQAAPTMAANVGSGGSGVSFLLGGGSMMTPEQLTDAGYGEIGSDSHNFALDNQKRGHALRYGLAGLGAFNAAYNQTSSGQPGVIGAAGQGAMTGYYGSQGLEDFAARAGRRFGGRNMSSDIPAEPVNTTALVPTNRTADPRQRRDGPIDVDFTEEEHDDQQGMLAEPTANMTTDRVAVRNPNPYNPMMDEYGRPNNPYDAIQQEY